MDRGCFLLVREHYPGYWLPTVPAAVEGPQAWGTLCGRVCNVLGDPISGAEIRLGEYYRARSDGDGRYVIEGVPVGQHVLELEAEGYRRERMTIQVETGDNNQQFTADLGLWPEEVAISFHVFTNSTPSDPTPRLFGYFGMANGTGSSVAVYSVMITDPQGEKVWDLVQDEDARSEFLAMWEEIAVVKDNGYHWVVPAHIVFEGELPSVSGAVSGSYSVTVAYSVGRRDPRQPVTLLTAFDEAEPDPDWNPRLP